MKMRYLVMLLLLSALMISGTAAQDTDPTVTNSRWAARMFEGPGATFGWIDTLQPGVDVRVVARNHTGTWVRIQRSDATGAVVSDGWIVSANLFLDDTLNFGDLPEESRDADGLPDNVYSPTESPLYGVPVISRVSESMRDVFMRGLELGNNPNVATKVGDSIIANQYYLEIMNNPKVALGNYNYLLPTLAYFGRQMTPSVAAQIGLSTNLLFDPFWSRNPDCEPNETPLSCEYRLKKPSIAFISFSQNDVKTMGIDIYKGYLSDIVQQSIDSGVIPVLLTFSSHPDSQFYDRSLSFNKVITEVAAEYQVPSINLWLASRILPDYGLEQDLAHLTNSGYTYLTYESGQESYSGVALLNLLSLRMLHELKTELSMDAPPPAEPTSAPMPEVTAEPTIGG